MFNVNGKVCNESERNIINKESLNRSKVGGTN